MESNHNYTYRLRNVPGSINLSLIRSHLSYYGPVVDLQEVDHLPPNHREVLCTFDSSANLRLLEHIWAVNIQGYNISIANVRFSAQQLDYRKQYVAGFRGFHHQTTESQALRQLRPYGRMTCYFHQNLAYIGFKTYDQMIAACQLRLYTDDDRLLTGQPRIAYLPSDFEANDSSSDAQQPKAMNYQTGAMPDLNVNQHARNRRIKKCKSNPKADREPSNMVINDSFDDNWEVTQSTGQHPISTKNQKCSRATLQQDDPPISQRHMQLTPPTMPPATSQLDLILAKLSELDTLKQHLTALDQRINLLTPQPSLSGVLAHRS